MKAMKSQFGSREFLWRSKLVNSRHRNRGNNSVKYDYIRIDEFLETVSTTANIRWWSFPIQHPQIDYTVDNSIKAIHMRHGLNDVTRQDNLITCHPYGAFNLDGIKDYEINFAKMVTDIQQPIWGIINIYHEFEIGGPDVIKRIQAQFHWSCAQGCQYMAFSTSHSVHDYFVEKIIEGVPFKAVKIFKDDDHAKAWVMQQLKEANKP